MVNALLTNDAVLAALPAMLAGRIGTLDVLAETGSTNDDLLAAEPPAEGTVAALVAERQTRGRGRHGRSWQMPADAGVCISVATRYRELPAELSLLTVATGVAIAAALDELAGVNVALKWPNDLLLAGRKLGGILLESRFAGSALLVVAGCGLNWRLPADFAVAEQRGLPPGDLAAAMAPGTLPPRAAVAATIVAAMTRALTDSQARVPEAVTAAFAARDFLRGRAVAVVDGGRAVQGIGAGVSSDGALLLTCSDGTQREIRSGSVELDSIAAERR